jgi:hypothetical protein
MAYRLTTQLAVLEASKREEYFSTEQSASKVNDTKQFQAARHSLWKLNRKRLGSKTQAIIRKLMGA